MCEMFSTNLELYYLGGGAESIDINIYGFSLLFNVFV